MAKRLYGFCAGKRFALVVSTESTRKLGCRVISLGGSLPAYVGEKQAADVRADEAVLVLLLESRGDEKRMAYLYLPAVPAVDDRLLSMLESCDLVLFDGTFWTDDELFRVQGGGRSAL